MTGNPGKRLPTAVVSAEETEALIRTVRIRSVVDSHAAAAIARRSALIAGLGSAAAECVAIVASELATNIARHAQQGNVRLYRGPQYLKVVAEDNGPGFVNVTAALVDGHSRGRQLGVDDREAAGIGCGLGAVHRLMDFVEIQSTPGVGTLVTAIKRRPRGRHA